MNGMTTPRMDDWAPLDTPWRAVEPPDTDTDPSHDSGHLHDYKWWASWKVRRSLGVLSLVLFAGSVVMWILLLNTYPYTSMTQPASTYADVATRVKEFEESTTAKDLFFAGLQIDQLVPVDEYTIETPGIGWVYHCEGTPQAELEVPMAFPQATEEDRGVYVETVNRSTTPGQPSMCKVPGTHPAVSSRFGIRPTIRQPFRFLAFPFDTQFISIRMQPWAQPMQVEP